MKLSKDELEKILLFHKTVLEHYHQILKLSTYSEVYEFEHKLPSHFWLLEYALL